MKLHKYFNLLSIKFVFKFVTLRMHFIKYLFCFWVITSFLTSCQPKDNKFEKISIYHWKLKGEGDNAILKKYQFENLYLHIMDVYWNTAKKEAEPKAYLNIKSEDAVFDFPVIPVIYIDNQVFANLSKDSIEAFTSKILIVKNAFQASYGKQDFKELQIDCDWLKSHKEKYFEFLATLKKMEPDLKISSTIRLYPYRYPDIMGVPPVDYGVLMCYNMDKFQEASTHNSVLDPAVLKQYLDAKEYPIPLKPALPIFGWYVWFKGGDYQSLLYLPNSFSENPLLQPIKSNNFRVLRDTVIGNNYLRVGDILRNEFPSIADLQESIHLINKKLPHSNELIWYHWDNENTLENYETILNQILISR